MNFKKLSIRALALLLLGTTYALVQPNIEWLNSIATIGSNYKFMVQSWTSQYKLDLSGFLNSIWFSWYVDMDNYLTWEVDPVWMLESGNYLKISNSWDYYTNNPLWYITGEALTGYVPYSGSTSSVNLWNNSLYSNNLYGVMWSMGLIFQDTPTTMRAMIWGISNGTFYLANLQSTWVILDVQQLTQDRTISFPDATWTLLTNTMWYLTNAISVPVRYSWSGMLWNDIQNTFFFDWIVTAQIPSRMAIGGGNIDTRCFDGGSQMNEMMGSVEIPHDMFVWTWAVLAPHVHMLAEQTEPDGTGVRYMDYMILSNWEAYSWAQVFTISGTKYWFTWRQANIIELDWNIFTGGILLWDMVSYRIYRTPTGADTYSARMCLQQVWFHYQIDALWSRQKFIK